LRPATRRSEANNVPPTDFAAGGMKLVPAFEYTANRFEKV